MRNSEAGEEHPRLVDFAEWPRWRDKESLSLTRDAADSAAEAPRIGMTNIYRLARKYI